MSAALYGRDATGVNRQIKKLYVNVGGVNRELKELWAMDSGGVNWKIFSSSFSYLVTEARNAVVYDTEVAFTLNNHSEQAYVTFEFPDPLRVALNFSTILIGTRALSYVGYMMEITTDPGGTRTIYSDWGASDFSETWHESPADDGYARLTRFKFGCLSSADYSSHQTINISGTIHTIDYGITSVPHV